MRTACSLIIAEMFSGLTLVIDEDEDSVLFYVLRTAKWMEREQLGASKGEPEWIV